MPSVRYLHQSPIQSYHLISTFPLISAKLSVIDWRSDFPRQILFLLFSYYSLRDRLRTTKMLSSQFELPTNITNLKNYLTLPEHTSQLPSNIPRLPMTSSTDKLRLKTKKKLNQSKSSTSESQDRVDKILQEKKQQSRARVEANKKKKLLEQAKAAKKKKQEDELWAKQDLERRKAETAKEDAADDAVMEYLDKEIKKHSQRVSKDVSMCSDKSALTSDDVSEVSSIEILDDGDPPVDTSTTGDAAQTENSPPTSSVTKPSQSISSELLKHIQSVVTLPQTASTNPNNDDSSVATVAANNSPKRNVNEALNGYKAPSITTHVFFCKTKIFIPASDKPTAQLRNTLIMFMTTLLKVDKDLVVYGYKDETDARYIKLPVKIPDVPSKYKEFFHGRFRPNSAASTIWPDIRIGFNSDPESFFSDARSLLEDKGNYGIFKKEIQAAETTDAGFFPFFPCLSGQNAIM